MDIFVYMGILVEVFEFIQSQVGTTYIKIVFSVTREEFLNLQYAKVARTYLQELLQYKVE